MNLRGPVRNSFTFALAAIFGLTLSGCNKEGQVDPTQPLQQSFQAAEPEVQKAIQTANENFKTENYLEASKALAPVVSNRPLTDAQKQAVSLALFRINKAIEANPNLDTKELYELRLKMYRAVDSSKRF
jgi:hypothetical protein